MDIYEQAAFWSELCNRGIAIYESPPDVDDDYPITIKKIATTADERIYLDEEHDELQSTSHDKAVEFIKVYIAWDWKDADVDNVDEEAEVELIRFDTFVLFDAGFGPQQRALGKVAVPIGAEDWQDQVDAAATKKAEAYVAQEYPGKKFADIQAQVKYQPSRE